MSRYLRSTPLLDIDHPSIQALVEQRGWATLAASARVGAVYAFVRDEIAFGYNASDDIPASQVLTDGYGQCNTKTTLLMALLRAVGIPARFHAATVHKRLQKGVVTGLLYRFAPRDILHSWAEVSIGDRWVRLEGVILDKAYLAGVRAWFPGRRGPFLGYAVGTDDFADPPVDWVGTDTAIQATGVSSDHGVHDDPDSYYREHGPQLKGVRGWLFRHRARPAMNGRVAAIRRSALLDDDMSCAVPTTGTAS
jgi:transglutaminase-like putative cysteine protease